MGADDRLVPCNGCSACCRRRRHCPLDPDDDVSAYLVDWRGGVPHLATRLDGDCVYLEDGRCSIYSRRPLVCRRFDCRDYVSHPLRHVRVAAEMARARA